MPLNCKCDYIFVANVIILQLCCPSIHYLSTPTNVRVRERLRKVKQLWFCLKMKCDCYIFLLSQPTIFQSKCCECLNPTSKNLNNTVVTKLNVVLQDQIFGQKTVCCGSDILVDKLYYLIYLTDLFLSSSTYLGLYHLP